MPRELAAPSRIQLAYWPEADPEMIAVRRGGRTLRRTDESVNGGNPPRGLRVSARSLTMAAVGDDCCSNKSRDLERLARQADQRRVLLAVLAINAAISVIESSAGVIARSAAPMVNSVDLLGDALVYGISLYAVARSERWEGGAALVKGGFILPFGVGVMIEIAVKISTCVPPESTVMLGIAAPTLFANLACLKLLWRFRTQDVTMASTFKCSRNDVIADSGVMLRSSCARRSG